eukprot:TRINITY_DN1490_c0_g1_i1.p1 TRINITY_DN1490_c0_g1~~TRINITY_DN1490_c0_g1_i1.p1  ORF type:complete len:455 (+),score=117.22 TRINITY_DN1490_c0_g1_i1:101-1465(+)
MKIIIKTLLGKMLSLDVESDLTISQLKDLIEKQENIPADQQKLIFAGKQVENDQTLSDCGVTKESTLHLISTQLAPPEPQAKKIQKGLSFPVKVIYFREDSQVEIRRFRWEGKPDMDRLFSLLESFFGVKNHNRFVLQYQIDDEDVTFSTTIEFEHLIELKRKELNPLKLDLKLKPKNPVAEPEKKAEKKAAVSEKKVIAKPEEKKQAITEKKAEEKKVVAKPEEKKQAITEKKAEEKKVVVKPEEKKQAITEKKAEEKKVVVKPEEKKQAITEKKAEEKKVITKPEEKKVVAKPEEKKPATPEKKAVKQPEEKGESSTKKSLSVEEVILSVLNTKTIKLCGQDKDQFVSVDEQGNLMLDPQGTCWKVELVGKSNSKFCLEAAVKPNGHLRIGPEGVVTANGGTGKWAQFCLSLENDKVRLRGVGNNVYLAIKQGKIVSVPEPSEGTLFHMLPQ